MDTIASENLENVSATVLVPGIHQTLSEYYTIVRQQTERLCRPLEIDDFNIQTMPDVSPTKWHLAHVSWFFETFLLIPYLKNYQPYHPKFGYLFNSYYETVGTFHPRPKRGQLSRPTVEEIFRYRTYVDNHMHALLEQSNHPQFSSIAFRSVVGINHEQQHQELMLTDIKHVFASNSLKPAYQNTTMQNHAKAIPHSWLEFDGGLKDIGNKGDAFCYDNELPVHKVYVNPFKLSNRLVSNGEYLEFIEAGGYREAKYWLADAWYIIKNQQWQAPLYWEKMDNQWWHMTLNGFQAVDESVPVCHVSYYEADAFARWKQKRLPLEHEWEVAAEQLPIRGNMVDSGILHPVANCSNNAPDCKLQQMFGDVWEWTQSPYTPYPGYKPLAGALGEYNGKFMSSQMVLRGGSCITPPGHIRPSYRNFFYPKDQWQFSGFRLADDI